MPGISGLLSCNLASRPPNFAELWYHLHALLAGCQLAACLQTCLSGSLIGGFVQSANCLLGRDGSAKLTDVGMAKIMRHKFLTTLQGQVGTFAW